MTRRDHGGPSFPQLAPNSLHLNAAGMTLRDWFAGQALAGMAGGIKTEANARDIGVASYVLADRMMEARK
jgi:hypothetical protein